MPAGVWRCLRITGKLCFARTTQRGVQRGSPPQADAEGLGVWFKIPNSLESLFGKEGLREFEARGLKAGMNVVLDEAEEVTYGGGFRFALSALHLPRV